jgi:YVTN family beta-propeller protein
MKCFARLLIFALCLTGPLFAATTITVGTSPTYLAVNSTTNRIYVSNLNSNSVSVIDGNSNTVVATVPLSASPSGIDVNPTTNLIYVATFLTGEVVVIDGSNNTVVTTITGVGADLLAVDVATNLIYAPHFLSTNVSVIDGASNTIVASIPVGKGPFGAAVNSVLNLIYVTNNSSGTISVIDGSTNTVTNTFTLPPFAAPVSIALDTKSNRLYVTDGQNRVVYVMNASTGKMVFLRGGNVAFTQPIYAAVLQPGKTVLISDDGIDNCLWPISETNNKAGTALKGFDGPIGIAVNQVTHKVYVANNVNNTVSVISH